MNKFKIFSDTSCDISYDKLESKYQIPFHISFDAVQYFKEKEELVASDFFNQLEGQYPKTSVPSVHDFIEKFKPELEESNDILCLTISSELSSSYQSAQNAKSLLLEDYPDRIIHIIDTRLATVPLGLLLCQILDMSHVGKSMDEIVEYTEKSILNSDVIFTVGDSTYLQKGGRIGAVVLKSAKSLKLKPIVSLKSGKIISRTVARGSKTVIRKLVEVTQEDFSDKIIDTYTFAVGYTDESTKKYAQELEMQLKIAFPTADFQEMFQIGAVIGAHTGMGTFGIGYTKKYKV